MADNSREIILDTLLELERGQQFSNRLVKAVLDKYDYLDTRDKAFIKRVTEGTVERKQELDYYLNAFSSVPVHKMKPLIRCLLRMSVYQLLYMESVPDSAVCNEACKLAVKRKFGNLKGFVNGVLRTVSRHKENLPLPDRTKEPVTFLAIRYSMPEWLVRFWLEEYGEEMTEQLLAGLLEVHPVSIRLRDSLPAPEKERLLEEMRALGVQLTQSRYLPNLYFMKNSDNVSTLPGFAQGLWTIQDVSSALAVEAAGIRKGDFVIDACAAPGGKTVAAAQKAKQVLARDISEEKVALIQENLDRMEAGNVRVQVWDANDHDADCDGKADVLILDVPCSGLGIIGKKRDIKYKTSRDQLEELTILQKNIIKACTSYVKPGGTLLYSTCTINRAENEEMVRFLTEQLGFLPQSLEGRIPDRLLQEKNDTLERRMAAGKDCFLSEREQAACIQLLPGYMESDGFFFAVFRRPEEQ